MTLRYEDVLADLRAWYDGEAAGPDGRAKPRLELDERAAFLDRLRVIEASSLLEVGAGTGQDGVYFRDAGLRVVAVDLSPEMVRRCREKGLEAQVRDVKHLGMPVGSFDAVWAMNCLLHVPDADLPAALREIRSALRPGGLFYVGLGSEPSGPFVAHRSDEQVFTAVREAFEVVDFHTVTDEGRRFQALTAVRPLD